MVRGVEQETGKVRLRIKVLALLGGAVAWTLHLGACYFVVALACTTGWNGGTLTITILTLLLGGLGTGSGVFALKHWRRVQEAPSWEHALNEAGGHEGLMFLVGILLSVVFVFLILLNGITPFMVPECPA